MTPQEAIEQLQQFAEQSTAAMRRGELKVANEIAVTAVGLAPEDTSQLVDSIGVEQTETETTVFVGAPYAPYVEFSTGGYAAAYVATLPPEWQEEAKQFFISGKGNTQGHPFFYPAILAHIDELPDVIGSELEKILK